MGTEKGCYTLLHVCSHRNERILNHLENLFKDWWGGGNSVSKNAGAGEVPSGPKGGPCRGSGENGPMASRAGGILKAKDFRSDSLPPRLS